MKYQAVVSLAVNLCGWCPLRKVRDGAFNAEGQWQPLNAGKTASKIRPLAHVTLKDQVIATAMMLCLADRVETAQGDPRIGLDSENLKSVTSYGNRLFCDRSAGQLIHRWGASKLYRGFYQDYQRFLVRPESVAEPLADKGARVVILQSDLRQFYDRVTPDLLRERVGALQEDHEEGTFFDLLGRFMDWRWAVQDLDEVQIYAEQAGLTAFNRVALPQGLVASGFFANVVLLNFDRALKQTVGREIFSGAELHDAVRYVDDLRLVLTVGVNVDVADVEGGLFQYLQERLQEEAPGLEPSAEKTLATVFRGDERPLVRQSRRMARIQTAISGGFDVIAGGDILDSVLGLVRTQERLAESEDVKDKHPFLAVPDVRDATVDRFAAGRFRTTYRSLRPLLWQQDAERAAADADDQLSQFRGTRTRAELDDEARAFAMGLIAKWVDDPSNVRLLRIGLDLWPAADVLQRILDLLRPFTEKGGLRKAPRRVAWYCLSEILRAGATETGFVEDTEALSDQLDIARYREVLRKEARRLVFQNAVKIPWYLKQQALLYLATNPPADFRQLRGRGNSETRHYRELIRFLLGESKGLGAVDYATYAIYARRSFLGEAQSVELVQRSMTPARLNRVAALDPNFAREIIDAFPQLKGDLTPRIVADLGLNQFVDGSEKMTLASMVLSSATREVLRNELSLLTFASAFLDALSDRPPIGVITPSDITLTISSDPDRLKRVEEVGIASPRHLAGRSLYEPPSWIEESGRWRFQLGYLLRFILTAQQDFTRFVRPVHWKERCEIYRPPESHWYQRIYGLFSGHAAFGDDWLPISEWTENLLFRLLSWPGCPGHDAVGQTVGAIEEFKNDIAKRVVFLRGMQGSSVALIPMHLPRIYVGEGDHPLRACIVQTVVPGEKSDFDPSDLTLSNPAMRIRHRRHLSAALAAVERALALRETHKGREGRLDLLILPELAVHPDDVQTHLVPFARAYKATILAGLTYQSLASGGLLVNSALWIMPTQDATRGLQILIRRQGKGNLAPMELSLNQPTTKIQPFRPCQWLIGYQWSSVSTADPLWLTAAICYDATDIHLAADLKNHSDVFIVPALNKDVPTFDQMALALHYHMFQMVIVANNGLFGGSNAYAPFTNSWERQVFHMHGQPQASIAFLEIDHIAAFKARKIPSLTGPAASAPLTGTSASAPYQFKPPPAGYGSK
ncbi:RNA-directed DNA polymerase [Mesorhizobium sp. M0772]|uniref:RNA-directed DNA polymerase n=1 Tax=Mesorhizobium sp. M0772 TaxID=2956998 RepID=UPI00333A14E2